MRAGEAAPSHLEDVREPLNGGSGSSRNVAFPALKKITICLTGLCQQRGWPHLCAGGLHSQPGVLTACSFCMEFQVPMLGACSLRSPWGAADKGARQWCLSVQASHSCSPHAPSSAPWRYWPRPPTPAHPVRLPWLLGSPALRSPSLVWPLGARRKPSAPLFGPVTGAGMGGWTPYLLSLRGALCIS